MSSLEMIFILLLLNYSFSALKESRAIILEKFVGNQSEVKVENEMKNS
jgi:hypothetical protein